MGRRLGIGVGILVALGAYALLDVRQRARVDRGVRKHRTDFTVYQAAGQALRQGEDPYDATNPRGYRYVYPPLLAVLAMPVAGWSPPDAALLFFALSVAALALALWRLACFRPRDVARPVGGHAVGLALLLCAGFAHQGFQRGQITHILLAVQIAGILCAARGRWFGAGAWFGLGAALRLTPLLPLGALGLGLLTQVRARGWRPVGALSAGALLALGTGFLGVPALALGADRAVDVNARWIEVTRDVYAAPAGEAASLERDYAINEFRFKNQAPRRVIATWTGWAQDVPFTKERPALDAAGWIGVDRAAQGVALAVLLLAAVLGLRVLGRPGDERGVLVLALLVFVPVLVTRYTWPTHLLMALPLLALLRPPRPREEGLRRRWPLTVVATVFLLTTLAFYAAHARPLQPVGEAGCLLLGMVVLAAGALLRVARLGRAS